MSKVVRTTKSEWQHNDESGAIQTTEITINFYGETIAGFKKLQAEIKSRIEADPNDTYFVTEDLHRILHSLQGLPEAAPQPITLEWLEEQDLANLVAVQAAIKESVDLGKPKKPE